MCVYCNSQQCILSNQSDSEVMRATRVTPQRTVPDPVLFILYLIYFNKTSLSINKKVLYLLLKVRR